MSKRQNIFGQGRREDEYAEMNTRHDEPPDPAKRATAAQLAGRKIKQPKSRLGHASSVGPSSSGSASNPFAFGGPSPASGGSTGGGFNFTASQPAPGFGGFGSAPSPAPQPSNPFGGFQASQPAPSGGAFGSPAPSQQAPTNGSDNLFSFNPQPSTPSGGGFGASKRRIGTTPGKMGTSPAPSSNIFANSSFPAFGSGSTTDSPAASNIFATSSFPPSGADSNSGTSNIFGQTQTSTFNFGASTAETTPNASQETAAATPFKFGASTTETSTPFKPSTPATNPFNFGASTADSAATKAQVPAATPFTFGGQKAETSVATSQPAATSLFSFGSTPKPEAPSPAATNPFQFGATSTEPPATPKPATPAATPFQFGQAAEPTPKPTTGTPTASLFNFGANTAEKPSTPADSAPTEATPAPKPAFNFGGSTAIGSASKPTTNTTTGFSFGSNSSDSPSIPKEPATEASPASKAAFNFGGSTNVASPSKPSPTGFNFGGDNAATPKAQAQPASPFGGEAFAHEPAATPKPASTGFNFGTTTNASVSTPKSVTSIFGSTDQASPSKPATSLFNTAPSAPSPEQKPQPAPSLINFGSTDAAAASPFKAQQTSAPSVQPFQPSAESKETAPPSQAPSVPRAYIPPTWSSSKPSIVASSGLADFSAIDKKLVELGAQLTVLNQKFKQKINQAPDLVDLSALSRWHFKLTKEIMKQFDDARKQRARLLGVTGEESALSTKRKVTESTEGEDRPATPSKKPRQQDDLSFTPKADPPVTDKTKTNIFGFAPKETSAPSQTSNLFGSLAPQSAPAETQPKSNLFGSKPSVPAAETDTTQSSGNSIFSAGPRTDVPTSSASLFSTAAANANAGSGFTAFGSSASKDSATVETTPSSGFKPSTFGASATGKDTASSGFKPSNAGNPVNSFAQSAAAARKAKAMKEDYDSDEETKEEWSARYDREEAERQAKEAEKLKAQATSGFSLSSLGTAAKKSSGNSFAESAAAARKAKAMKEDYDSDEETKEEWSARYDREEAERQAKEAEKLKASGTGFSLSTLASSDKAAPAKSPFSIENGASGTTSQFTSGAVSPAPSTTGGQSVFDSAAPSPAASNPFANLSSASPSQQEESDADDEEGEQGGEEEKDAGDETEEDDESEKPQETSASKPSLLSRISFGGQPDKEKDGQSTPLQSFEKSNGTSQTPKQGNGPFQFFDFAAASRQTPPPAGSQSGATTPTPFGAQTAPPKPTDQTYKPGTPLKFSASLFGNNGPAVNFEPASPSSGNGAKGTASNPFANLAPANSDTAAKPNPFAFLGNSASQASKAPSLLAPTPGGSSAPGSVFSSRAPTPLSDAGFSDKSAAAGTSETATGNDDDADEGSKGPQLDLSTLTEDEKKDHDILFHASLAIAKHQVEVPKDDANPLGKMWKPCGRGPIWILKNKESGKVLVRIRIPSGATPVNYNILPKIKTSLAGKSKKMVLATRPGEGGKLSSLYISFQNTEDAEGFSETYNNNLPAA